MKKGNYILYKDNYSNDIVYAEYNKDDKLKIAPKNQLQNILSVEKLVIVSEDFSKKIAKKVVNKKLKRLVDWLIDILEEDSDSGTSTQLLIQECEKFKISCLSKYQAYLTPQEIEELFAKVDVMYNHLKQIKGYDYGNQSYGRSR